MAVLAHQLVGDESATRWVLFAHGIFGRGQNLRSTATKLCAACPGLGAVLVDLRGHGGSAELAGLPTIEAAAADVVETVRHHAESLGPVTSLIGHSFGGKVVLLARAALAPSLTWVLDSTPSRRPGGETTAASTLDALEGAVADSGSFADRKAFVSALEDLGVAAGVGQFLAMNLEGQADGGYRLAIDLTVIRALLVDYFATDAWSRLIEPGGAVHFAVAGRDSALSPSDLERLESVAAASPSVSVHYIEDAGHWLHVDAPSELLACLVPTFTVAE